MEEKIKTGMLYRKFAINREVIDKETRMVELSFSSEVPVARYFGYEILSHDEGAVRLDRLNNGAPLLLNHNTDEQIGVVDKAFIGPDRKGRALVRFSRSQRAEEIFQDVIDGIRKNVSVGYLIHSMKFIEKKGEDTEYYLADNWEPLEISTVPVPADNSIGIGRAAEFKDFQTKIEKKGEVKCLLNSMKHLQGVIARDESILKVTKGIMELVELL